MISDIENNLATQEVLEEGYQVRPVWRKLERWTAAVFRLKALSKDPKGEESTLSTSTLTQRADSSAKRENVDNSKSTLDNLDQTRQFLLLCLRSRKGHYAVQVPCFRPTQPHNIIPGEASEGPDSGSFIHRGRMRCCESDAEIWHRIKKTYFENKGKWKEWLPFYGPTIVREVEFQFVSLMEKDSRYRVFDVTPIDISKVRRQIDDIIASEPRRDGTDECLDDFHIKPCPRRMDEYRTCITIQVRKAKGRKRQLGMLGHLVEFANKPDIANDLKTLGAMAPGRLIYDPRVSMPLFIPEHDQTYHVTDTPRGIEMVMGWQVDRIKAELPPYIGWTWFGVVVVWLCVIVWGGRTADWSTAMALGQLLAAIISLVVVYARD